MPEMPLSVYMWFAANSLQHLTLKVYAVAHDVGEARRLIMSLPRSPEITVLVLRDEPLVWGTPWAEINASNGEKAMSYATEAPK
jgi:hypothetical protein